MPSFDWANLVYFAITLVFGVATFFFGRLDLTKKDRLKLVRDLTDKALTYWGMNESAEAAPLGFIILSYLSDLESMLPNRAQDAFLNYKRAITDGDFQESGRQAAMPRSRRIERIEMAKLALIKHL